VLILVPSSLRFTWAKMCVDWLHVAPDDITVVVAAPSRMARAMGYTLVSPPKGGAALRLEGQVNILSYDILPKLQHDLAAARFQVGRPFCTAHPFSFCLLTFNPD
jgi:SWI/SNF-related matrix-associated actin-dependent regulator 1 of chromatin subfamily A